ncbi:MAG: DUF4337 domain-containing protein [Bacteroidetes bacterium]|nr:DUF4337 domain-containing protein [Bacteroidota bacterium]
MEEMEIPTEHLHEAIHEKAEEGMKEEKEKWALYVALSTAMMAVLAAIAGLLSGHHVNEAMIDQIKSSDQWAFYQAKSIKADIAASSDKIIQAVTNKPVADNSQTTARYEKEKEEIKASAEEHAKDSETHLGQHVTLSKAVTIFQIAIAISAISILTKRKSLWFVAMLLTAIGSVFLIMGLFH